MIRLISILALAALACGMSAGMTPAAPATPTVQFTAPPKVKATATPRQVTEYQVTAETLYLRSGAGMSYQPIEILYDGEIVNTTTESMIGVWMQVTNSEGVTGWVNYLYLEAVK